jgi:putative SOS response-associated peptidase YedK
MCGRYTQHQSTDQIVIRFEVTSVLQEAKARYNIAPTQMAPIVIQDASSGERRLESARWGLIPSWARDMTIGSRLLNARSETAAEKPSFRSALSRRRCLIPTDGYYEWKMVGKTRQPLYYHLRNSELFAFAGLWETWQSPEGQSVHSFTILTTEPNALAAEAHDRMPVILRPEQEALWLDPEVQDVQRLKPIYTPFPEALMDVYPVSSRVNKPIDDDAGLIARLEAASSTVENPETLSLF